LKKLLHLKHLPEIYILKRSGLLDRAFYLRQNPDIAQAGWNPLLHYLELGAAEGRDPNPLFSASWYCEQNPLLHYYRKGWKQGKNPHPLFDVAFYLKQHPGVEPLRHYLETGGIQGFSPHPLFDGAWYLAQNPDVARAGSNPLVHYLHEGWKERRNPHPLFDVAFYLRRNPDIAQAGTEPLVHFLTAGGSEGRSPHPLFDCAWYLGRNPEARQTNPLLHYLQTGWKQGRNPHPLFDVAFYAGTKEPLTDYVKTGAYAGRDPHPLFDSDWYLEHNPDVKAAGRNPLAHYVEEGWKEKRNPQYLFDIGFYFEQNPDVAESGWEPLRHYLELGGFEGRDPHPLFDNDWYLERNPDVKSSGVNPLAHYRTKGWREGRNPHPFFDIAFYLKQTSVTGDPLQHYLEIGGFNGLNPNPLLESEWYLTNHFDVAAAGINPLLHYLREGRKEGRQPRPGRPAYKPHTRMRVVFVSGEPDSPGHDYRVVQIASSLPPSSFETVILKARELPARSREAAGADVLWLWRTIWTADLAELVQSAAGAQTTIVFDVDDLTFRPDLAVPAVIDGIRSQTLVEKEVQDAYKSFRSVLMLADHGTSPTLPLVREMRQLGKPATVIPNGFTSKALLRAQTLRIAESDGLIRIGYAAGTKTHQRDLAIASRAIASVLKNHGSARLVLFRDTVDLDEFPELLELRDQIEWRERVPLNELLSEYARFDINIAPVEAGNPFCEAKSQLKFFEAALVDVPTIASPTQPFAEAIRNWQSGILATTADEWHSALETLIGNPHKRRCMARQAKQDALWLYGPERRSLLTTTLLHYLRSEPSVTSKLFLSFKDWETAASLPSIDIPEYEVLYESARRGPSRVSVVVPLFNYAHFLPEALNSVLQQTVYELDLIVVDDQSTDNSAAVAREWLEQHAARFNKVALLQNRINSKLGPTRNSAISFAETEFILPLDPDNVLLPECVDKCIERLHETGAAFAYPTIERVGAWTDRISIVDYDPTRFQCANYIDAMAMLRKACWVAVGGYARLDLGWEDYDLWCKFVERGFFGVRVPEVLARYRVHENSMLRTTTETPENLKRILQQVQAGHPWLARNR
jgi:glycosyltransferase involved in cell wall biosynthesis